MAEKTYIAHLEFISRDVKLESGANTNELYELEKYTHEAIKKVVEWREKNLNEKYWQEALPQTLLEILGAYDGDASEVAAKCFIKKERIEKKVNRSY